MNDISALRELRPAPPPAELETMRMAARSRFVAGTVSRPAPARPRWRRPVLAGGVITAAAAAGAAVGLVLTSGVLTSGPAAVPAHPAAAGHSRTVVTTAWTVREDADGTISIYLQQFANPAGLQATLQADGVNAIVRAIPYTLRTFLNSSKPVVFPTCNYVTINDRAPQAVQRAVLTVGSQALPALFVIHPDAMPTGSALFLAFMVSPPRADGNIALKPVVLDNGTVPACVPFPAKPALGAPANTAVKAGSPVPSAPPTAA
jgi:hypothetical protein